jgi:sulfur-oxidizing protein SoxY
MMEESKTIGLTRRGLLMASSAGSLGLAGIAFLPPPPAQAGDAAIALIYELTGRTPTKSDRLRLDMPAEFPTGYTVPMMIEVDSPMTDADYVKRLRVFAPKNPIIEVAAFHFSPRHSIARVSTRIRLAQPQDVLAVAEMSDQSLFMAKAWVNVASNGCI